MKRIALAALGAAIRLVVGAAETPFSEARLFFELNNTDGDLGIHAEIDGDPWKPLDIEDPSQRHILDIVASGRLRRGRSARRRQKSNAIGDLPSHDVSRSTGDRCDLEVLGGSPTGCIRPRDSVRSVGNTARSSKPCIARC